MPYILSIALPLPLKRFFDYLPPIEVKVALEKGIRVRVPFQNRSIVGFLVEVKKETTVPLNKLKNAIEVLDEESLFNADILTLCEWAASYYHYSLGEILAGALPIYLRKGKPLPIPAKQEKRYDFKQNPLELNSEQKEAVAQINRAKNQFNVFLLEGVTGSGKTEVYLQAIQHQIDCGLQVLVLIPEINLTPQTISRFRSRFTVPIVSLHSELTEKERLEGFVDAKSGLASIVIGTRSAIYTPFAKLGLIIVDEEHDHSFKQQDRFRYHARDLAIIRARINQIPIVLGSATPSLESILNVERNRYHFLSLPNRAGKATLPTFELIDASQIKTEVGFTETFLSAMKNALAANNQVMIFLNRRGFAPLLYCINCARSASCHACEIPMVFHRTENNLQCHHCDAQRKKPMVCDFCNQATLSPLGFGTERLEDKLKKLFPSVPILRIDRDSTRKKGTLEKLLNDVHSTEKAILVGTQMLAKGHHFPNVTLVGIIDADQGLYSPNYRASEWMGQLLMQVSGRAGREEKPGKVIIQTRQPDHPLLQLLITEGYKTFAKTILTERAEAELPPFIAFAIIRVEAKDELKAKAFLETIKATFVNDATAITILGPAPGLLKKKRGLYQQHLLLKGNRNHLQHFLKENIAKIEALSQSYPIKWILDVDPLQV